MPILWASGVEGIWDYLVIDLLGPSLDNLFRKSGKTTMDLRSVCSIAMQVVCRITFVVRVFVLIAMEDIKIRIHALERDPPPRYPAWKLRRWIGPECQDDLHD